MSQNKSERFNVTTPIERQDGKTFWLRIGTAFRNKDASLNIYLDALPVNGKLQVRSVDDQRQG